MMRAKRVLASMAAVVACAVAGAVPLPAQRGPRRDLPAGAEIAQKARAAKLDDTNKLTAEFQGQPILYTPAVENGTLGSLDELRAGRFLGVLDTKATGDETGLPPGTYNILVAEVDGKWRAFAEANGEIVKEAARVRLTRLDKGDKKPRFEQKGWGIADPICCVESDPDLGYANTVVIAPEPASVAAGRTTQLTPTVYDALGRPVSGATVTWQSSNPAVATVSSTGVVQGAVAGTVTVTATSGVRSGTVTVNVTPPPVASLQLSPATASIRIGEIVTLTATPLDAQGRPLADRSVGWQSSVRGAVSLTLTSATTARLMGMVPGTVTITALSEGVSASVPMTIANSCACTIVMSPNTLSNVSVGTKPQFTARAKAPDGRWLPLDRQISWSARAPAIMRLVGLVPNHDGKTEPAMQFEALAPGKAVTSAAIADQVATVETTVTGPAARFDVSPAVTTVDVGRTAQVNASAVDAGGTAAPSPGTVTWTSSDPTVFVVSGTGGVVTGVTPGTATLTATAGAVVGTGAVVVRPAAVASVTVTPSSTGMGTGSTLALIVTLRDAGGSELTDREVRWTTSSTAIAAVDQLGIVTAGTPGTATITATSEGKSGTATVSVPAPSTPPATTTAVLVQVDW